METVKAASRRCNLRWPTVSHNSKEGHTTTLVVLEGDACHDGEGRGRLPDTVDGGSFRRISLGAYIEESTAASDTAEQQSDYVAPSLFSETVRLEIRQSLGGTKGAVYQPFEGYRAPPLSWSAASCPRRSLWFTFQVTTRHESWRARKQCSICQ